MMLAADPRGASIAASADNASSRAWGWYRGAPQAVPRRYLQLIRKVRFWPILLQKSVAADGPVGHSLRAAGRDCLYTTLTLREAQSLSWRWTSSQ